MPLDLDGLRAIVGDRHLHSDTETRARYGRSSGFEAVSPPAVVCPENTAQVSQILALAHLRRFGVYPISGGKNWGYGDASGMTQNDVIVDLGRMSKVVHVDVAGAYAVVEAGVTQGQLAKHLTHHQLPLWMDSTGAGPDCSIVGNFADRGFGHTRYGDHFASCTGLEVVLADGKILRTGFGHFAAAKAEHVFRYGVGPSLDGLFSQSNMGVITRMGVCLMPEPQDYTIFVITVAGDDDIHGLIDALKPLRQGGVMHSCVHILNDIRIFSGAMRYPWELAHGQTPLPASLRRQLQASMGVGSWNATGILTGTPQMTAAARQAMRQALKGYKVRFFSKKVIGMSGRLAAGMRRLPALRPAASRLALLEPAAAMMRGQPARTALPGALWRVKDAPAQLEVRNVLDHHAGLAWISPVMPAQGAHTRAVMGILAPIYARFGFDFMGTFTMLTERAVVLVSNIAFDARDQEDRKKGEACYHEAMHALMKAGYVPYRCNPRSSHMLTSGSQEFWQVVGRIKHALDPHDVLSRGRYQPLDHQGQPTQKSGDTA